MVLHCGHQFPPRPSSDMRTPTRLRSQFVSEELECLYCLLWRLERVQNQVLQPRITMALDFYGVCLG